jgi:hypothetical protein
MEIIQFLYYLSSPILVILAGIGLYQLKISKDNAKISAKRESMLVAAEQCKYLLSVTMPLTDKFELALEKNGITFFEDAVVEVEEDGYRVKAQMKNGELEKLDKLTSDSVAVYNSLESFATFFTSGVADEQLAFNSVGSAYCDVVKTYLPELLPFNEYGKHYNNIIELFSLWNRRLEAIETILEKQRVDEKMKKIDNKYIKPLGT